ncbi:gliding motility-associated peptidyl-prolyl isomerase GldI [Lutimonas sp.]|uniref:gliding motility-associated peptidyl-prolyl isomerase GldI n=1 Tax=Lutimonas sp. TaxID=1872403 RepID=UPI003D9BEA5D
MKYAFVISIVILFAVSCSSPEARKPIVRKTSSFMNESIERNKMLNKAENAVLLQRMKSDSLHTYLNSENGYWYYYEQTVSNDDYTPNRGDEVFYKHEIKALNGTVIYAAEDLGTKSYLIDKEELITGLQDGLKLMKEGEKVTFLFPSYKAYGYTGFDKVKPNQPLLYSVELLKINKLSENENN